VPCLRVGALNRLLSPLSPTAHPRRLPPQRDGPIALPASSPVPTPAPCLPDDPAALCTAAKAVLAAPGGEPQWSTYHHIAYLLSSTDLGWLPVSTNTTSAE